MKSLANRHHPPFFALLAFSLFSIALASVPLGPDLSISWRLLGEEIEFTLEATTTGYLAVAFSVPGSHIQDVIFGWVDDHGTGHLLDCHKLEGKSVPAEDPIQNYKLLEAFENTTSTIIRFSRPWDTCDRKGDVILPNDTIKVIYTVGETDPGKYTWAGIKWRQAQSLHLMSPPISHHYPVNLMWEITAQDITLPEDASTFYWCKIYKAPPLNTKNHIIGYRPMLEEGHENYVEHMVLYECLVGREFEKFGSHPGSHCHTEAPQEWRACGTPIIAWHSGSRGEFFPEHVGMPMAEGEGRSTYFMLEIHYDNPRLEKVRDNSGLQIYYTSDLRKYDASLFLTGLIASPVQIIPPKQQKFSSSSYCDDQCTNLLFPEKGIRVISVTFHTHNAGQKVRLRHVREGQELPPLAEDNHFDPHYQQSRQLRTEAIVLPGDDLITECTYSTKNRTKLTLGGYSTRQETCMAYVLYYPRTALASCTSMTEVDFFFGVFGITQFYHHDMSEVEKILTKVTKKSVFRQPKAPMQSLFFRFTEKEGFNIDPNPNPSMAVQKAMAELNIDMEGDEDSPFSDLIIYEPEEFQNKTIIRHLKHLPWNNWLFTAGVEKTLRIGKYRTFCRLQDNSLAMPSSVYRFPNFTAYTNYQTTPYCSLAHFNRADNSARKSSFPTPFPFFLIYLFIMVLVWP